MTQATKTYRVGDAEITRIDELRLAAFRLALKTFAAERTILMMHGATYSSESLFDAPLGGVSFMDYLAGRGYDVFAIDVRGYGGSTRPPQMEALPEESEPLVRTECSDETGLRGHPGTGQ